MKSQTQQLTEEFISCTLPKKEWTHHAYLRVGLWHLLHYSPLEALTRLRQNIKQYNISCGIENTENQGYHETITRFYLLLIHQFIWQTDRTQPIDLVADELINCYGDRFLPFEYYSRDRLMSQTARFEWVEPDLKSLTDVIN